MTFRCFIYCRFKYTVASFFHSKPEVKDATPLRLVELKRNMGKDYEYKILDIVQEHILKKFGLHKTLTSVRLKISNQDSQTC